MNALCDVYMQGIQKLRFINKLPYLQMPGLIFRGTRPIGRNLTIKMRTKVGKSPSPVGLGTTKYTTGAGIIIVAGNVDDEASFTREMHSFI